MPSSWARAKACETSQIWRLDSAEPKYTVAPTATAPISKACSTEANIDWS